jgi:hypothetical protein
MSVLCPNGVEETVLHIFLYCQFSISCWDAVGVQVLLHLAPSEVLLHFKTQLAVPFFMEIITVMCQSIWCSRNDFIFNGVQPSLAHCMNKFKTEFALVVLRVRSNFHPAIEEWLVSLM